MAALSHSRCGVTMRSFGWSARSRSCRGAACAALAVAFVSLAAQQQPDPAEGFTVADLMIPMRDGIKLHTKIFTPKDQREPLPFIMKRTPYGIERSATNFTAYMKALADEGYLFV